jgi:hypothetical protein
VKRKRNEGLKLFAVRLDEKLVHTLKLHAVINRTTVQQLTQEAVESYLKHHGAMR